MQAAATSDLSPGAIFVGRYRIERRIATGGMGAVYEVVHLETNRRRALKVMHPHFVTSDELRGRFRQEARVAAEIESDHIVDVFDAGIDESTGMPFLVMELLRGEELGKLIKRVGPLPKEDVVRYLYETSLALDKTHRARIVHRDLKPDNLFLCERDHGPPRVKVLDFGIAKIVSDASTKANATQSLGTPLYMAPEQFVMRGAISPATDIFALGMIAFTLLVGKPYWYQESKMAGEVLAFALHVASGPQESPVSRALAHFGVQLSPAFDTWFFRATARDPAARFPKATDAVIALAQALGVPSPAEVFAPAPRASLGSYSVIEPPTFTPVQSTVVLPAVGSSSPTGPTQMAMAPTPAERLTLPNNRSHVLVIASIGATLVLGLAILLLVNGFSGGYVDKPAEAKPKTAAEVPTASGVPVVVPVASVAAVEPVASAAAAPTAAEAHTAKVPEPSAATKSTSKVITAPAPTTTTKSVTKKSAKGVWTDD